MLTAKSPVVDKTMLKLVPAPGVTVRTPVDVISPPLTARSPSVSKSPVSAFNDADTAVVLLPQVNPLLAPPPRELCME